MVELQLFYWHWLLLGIVLAMAEMFLASFTILWFGLGAILVGVVLLVFPSISFGLQLFAWIVFSGGFAIFWFKYFRPLMVDKTKAGIPRESVIGESGTVIKIPIEGSRGIARFIIPVLGEDEWEFISEQKVAVGDRVYIKDVSGNTLIVTIRLGE